MTTKERIREIIFPELITGDDGYKIWWPTAETFRRGGFDAHTLRLMAEILDEENQEWDSEVNKYFASKL